MEALPTLTGRVKWCEQTDPIKERDVVYVGDPNLPRSQWCRGVVTGVRLGSDNVARSATVKIVNGVIQRPVSRLAVLEVDSEADCSTEVGLW